MKITDAEIRAYYSALSVSSVNRRSLFRNVLVLNELDVGDGARLIIIIIRRPVAIF